MVKDIICINIGRTGVKLGDELMKLFADEHNVGSKDEETENPFFDINRRGKAAANSIFVDLDPSAINQVKAAEDSWLYDKSLFINGREDAAGNFGIGYSYMTDAIVDDILDGIRKLSESKKHLQGFLVLHSLGGGTGSGLTSVIMEAIYEEYKKKNKISFSTLSGNETATSKIDAYNTVLGLHKTLDHFDVTFLFSNEAVGNIVEKNIYSDINFQFTNDLMVQGISCITASARFDGGMNRYLKEYPATIAPFPRLHFPITAFAPLHDEDEGRKHRKHHKPKEKSLTSLSFEALNPGNQFVESNILENKAMACCYLYRGNVDMNDANRTSRELKDKKVLDFPMTPTSYKVSVVKQPIYLDDGNFLPDSARNKCVCALVNGTAICDTLSSYAARYCALREKKIGENWLLEEGQLDPIDLDDAEEDIKQLNNDYLEVIAPE